MRLRRFLVLVALSTALTLVATVAARHPRVRAAGARLRRSWAARVAIEGPSMEPTMRPGDWLLVDPLAYRHRQPGSGALVLAPDPREPERLLIKRVASVEPDGWLRLAGDDPGRSTDSRVFGAVDPSSVAGAPWFRYWPPRRIGRVSSLRLPTIDGIRPPTMDLAPVGPEAELTAGSRPYLEVLEGIHKSLAPESYLEVGVRHGRSLALARCAAIGIDPDPEVDVDLPPSTRVFRCTSDTFFEEHAEAVPRPIDLAFIDGMHLFECALRDLMHIERLAGPGSLVVIDDVLPNHPLQASRERRTRVWTGDVWKLQACLQEYRPALTLLALDIAPAGLLLVAGLDPDDRGLWEGYDAIVRRFAGSDLDPPEAVLRREDALHPDDPQVARLLASLRRARLERVLSPR